MTVSQPNGSIDVYTLRITGRCVCVYVNIMTTGTTSYVIVHSSLIRTIVYILIAWLHHSLFFFFFEWHNDTRDFSLFDISRLVVRYVNILLSFILWWSHRLVTCLNMQKKSSDLLHNWTWFLYIYEKHDIHERSRCVCTYMYSSLFRRAPARARAASAH